jgi:hypothetical protein
MTIEHSSQKNKSIQSQICQNICLATAIFGLNTSSVAKFENSIEINGAESIALSRFQISSSEKVNIKERFVHAPSVKDFLSTVKYIHPNLRVLVWRENHLDDTMYKEVIENIKILKESGFTHFAIEKDKRHQVSIDRFQSTGDTRHLDNVLHYSLNRDFKKEILLNVNKAGLKIIAVDYTNTLDIDRISGNSNGLLFTGTVPEGKRDDTMAEVIAQTLIIEPKSKIFFQVGSVHAINRRLPDNFPFDENGVGIDDPNQISELLNTATSKLVKKFPNEQIISVNTTHYDTDNDLRVFFDDTKYRRTVVSSKGLEGFSLRFTKFRNFSWEANYWNYFIVENDKIKTER